MSARNRLLRGRSGGGTPTEGGGWNATETSLRALYAANSGLDTAHTLAALASPPTVTVTGATTTPAGMTVAYTFIGGSLIPFYVGGGATVVATNYRRFPSSSAPAGVSQFGNGEDGGVWRVSVRTSSPRVSFLLGGSGSIRYRLLVRDAAGIDQYFDKAGFLNAANGFVTADAGSAADRIWTIEGQTSTSFRQVNVDDGYTATNPDDGIGIAMFLGDSITAGAVGLTFRGDAFPAPTAESLGVRNFWASGQTGTGYIADNAGTRYKLSDRLAADINRAKAIGNVVKVFVAMGTNDRGLA
jgi:hypothetical protein